MFVVKQYTSIDKYVYLYIIVFKNL